MNHSVRYAALIQTAIRRADEELRQKHPEFASLKYKADVRAYPKPPKGWSKHPERVVKAYLTSTQFLTSTNADIVTAVREWFAPYKPSQSIMTRPLQRSSIEAIQALLDQRGLDIKVKPTDTLSKLKKAIQAGGRIDKRDAAGTITLEVTQDFVIANGLPYKVDKTRRHPAIRVTVDGKRQYLRCDHLLALTEIIK